jgi:predicted nucleic-acid-binding Zn-ribbon protein
MKNGICPKCNSTAVYFKEYALAEVTLDGKNTGYVNYVCTDCGYFETYITDREALVKIVSRAEKLGDWKKTTGK